MKKIFLIIIVLSLKISISTAQWVTIPNASFVAKLTQLYPSCMNGNQMDTTCIAITNEDSLILNWLLNISDFTGIEYFDNLIYLDCSYINIAYIPAFPRKLKYIDCGLNQLSSLPALPDSLIFFRCPWNQLTSLPSFPNSITSLSCQGNNLTNLPTLPDSLINLSCFSNQLTSLPALPDSLNILYCYNNLLTSLPTLPSQLKALVCSYNQLTALPELPIFLEHLECTQNNIQSIQAFPNTLSILYCNYNQLTYLPALPSQMEVFRIEYNHINCLVNLPETPIDTFGTSVSIQYNPLSCLPNQTWYSPFSNLPLCSDVNSNYNPNNCPGAEIKGYIYSDDNNDCSYNFSDGIIENFPVKLFDNQNNLIALSYSTSNMYKFIGLNPDTFYVTIEDSLIPVAMGCNQPNYQMVTIDSINQTISNINFPLACDTISDVFIQSIIAQGVFFPGQLNTINTNINTIENWFNLDCDSIPYSGNVTINITGPISYVSASTNALTPIVNGNIFTYAISDFNSLTPESFGLQLLTDTMSQIGEQVCVQVLINTNPNDGNSINNLNELCFIVGNSFDPNMKEVYPVNVLPGYDDWLTYTIHFQNTGNAPAFNIRLRDTLDTHLDLNTFEVLGSSHAANTTLYGNILAVRFNNIMLPDSTTDHDGSMGYFQYRIKPLPNLPKGTQISNTAYIYFDYNAPIVTNTTQNNFDFITEVKDITDNSTFVLYPNPSAGLFNFMDNSKIKTVEVYNLLGEKILSQTNQKQIDLRHCAKGIFFVKINGTTMFKLVKEK